MSVLLEALKKAAAEKKKAMDNTIDSSIVQSDSNNVPELAVPPALKLAAEESVPVTSKNEASNSSEDTEIQADTALKFTLSDMSTPVSNQGDLNLSNAEPSILLESTDLDSDNIQPIFEDNSLLLKQGEQKEFEPSLEQAELSEDSFQASPTELNDSEAQKSTNPDSVDAFETDKDSFEWSMNALPGYSTSSMDDSVPIEKNSILLTGALTSEPKVKKKSHSRWLLVLVVVLMFIGISVYGLIYYQEQSEQLENSMRKYQLAKMQVSLPKKQPPIETVTDDSVQKTKDSNSEIDSTPIETLAKTNQTSEKPVTNIEQDNPVIPVAQNDSVTPVRKVSNKGVVKPKVSHNSINNKVVTSTTKPVYQPVLVQVNKTEVALAAAYSAYDAGHLELSQQKFSDVLSFDPKNITAMIGLGGIAASRGQHYVAMDYYQQALNVDPNSLEVYEAIANLSSTIVLNSDWNDSLKTMAKIYPNSETLQYVLGNLYASSNDWLAAQESYFNAYALDMNNPDFAVNLAISLDQLGKYPLAAQYYTQALALAGSNKVNFNISDIKNRLVSIRQFMDQEK